MLSRLVRPVVSLCLAACAIAGPRTGATTRDQMPLPDAESFLAQARVRLASNDRLQSRFSYKERVTELKLNPFGRMGTDGVVVAEVYPSAEEALTYRRIIERDGRPVPVAEIAEQDRRYRGKFDDWRRRLAREARSEREARLARDAEMHARDQARLKEALGMFTFTLEKREMWEGRSTIVVAFTPRSEVSPRSRDGRIAKSFAGRAWIDEAEHEVTHLEAKAIDDVSIGYGLIARMNPGSTAVFTRRKQQGAWLPTETRFQATGRALLVRRVAVDFVRTYSDYRPFDPSELPARLGWR